MTEARKRRALIAGGGTGGHFYPALVLAKTLRARGWEPLLLVRKNDSCLPVLESESIAACEVDMRGLPRAFSPAKMAEFAWKLPASFSLVSRVVKDFQPDIAVGMGGYLTFPAIAAAARRRVPRAVHEANVSVGLANKMSLALGAALFRGLPGAGGVVTGTPIRPSLWSVGKPEAARAELGMDEKTPAALVFGGSQGARSLNASVPELMSGVSGIQILHLAGAHDAAEVKARYERIGLRARVLPYLEKMELAYAAADVVVCRAGASTLAELAAQRKPAILIPFPHAAANHQEENAALLESAGAAVMIREGDLPRDFRAAFQRLLADSSARQAMIKAFDRLAIPAAKDAEQKLADAVEGLAARARV